MFKIWQNGNTRTAKFWLAFGLLAVLDGTLPRAWAQEVPCVAADSVWIAGGSVNLGTPSGIEAKIRQKRLTPALLAALESARLIDQHSLQEVRAIMDRVDPDLWDGFLVLREAYRVAGQELGAPGDIPLAAARLGHRLELLGEQVSISMRNAQRAGDDGLLAKLGEFENAVLRQRESLRPGRDIDITRFANAWNRSRSLFARYRELDGKAQAAFLEEMGKLESSAQWAGVVKEGLKGATVAAVGAVTLGAGVNAVSGVLEGLDDMSHQLIVDERWDPAQTAARVAAGLVVGKVASKLVVPISRVGEKTTALALRKGASSRVAAGSGGVAVALTSEATELAGGVLQTGVESVVDPVLHGELPESDVIVAQVMESIEQSFTPEAAVQRAGANTIRVVTANRVRAAAAKKEAELRGQAPSPAPQVVNTPDAAPVPRPLGERAEARLRSEGQVIRERLEGVSLDPPVKRVFKKLTPPGSPPKKKTPIASSTKSPSVKPLNKRLADLPGVPKAINDYRKSAHAQLHDAVAFSNWLVQLKRDALLDMEQRRVALLRQGVAESDPVLRELSRGIDGGVVDRKSYLRTLVKRARTSGLTPADRSKAPWSVIPPQGRDGADPCCTSEQFLEIFRKNGGAPFLDLPFHPRNPRSSNNRAHGSETHIIQMLYLAETLPGGAQRTREYLQYLGEGSYRRTSSTKSGKSQKEIAEDIVDDLWAPVFDADPGRKSPSVPEYLRPVVLRTLLPVE